MVELDSPSRYRPIAPANGDRRGQEGQWALKAAMLLVVCISATLTIHAAHAGFNTARLGSPIEQNDQRLVLRFEEDGTPFEGNGERFDESLSQQQETGGEHKGKGGIEEVPTETPGLTPVPVLPDEVAAPTSSQERDDNSRLSAEGVGLPTVSQAKELQLTPLRENEIGSTANGSASLSGGEATVEMPAEKSLDAAKEGSEAPAAESSREKANLETSVTPPVADRTTAPSREKGIVISLYNDIVPLGLSLIRDLRCMGNQEIIQVYHCLPDEMSAESREKLQSADLYVEVVDVCSDYIDAGRITRKLAAKFRNWWVKPLALHHTNLRNVLILDADSIPLQDPAIVRTLPGYIETGTTFFYDRVIDQQMFFNGIQATGRGRRQVLQNMVETFDYSRFGIPDGVAPSQQLLQSLAYAGETGHEMDSSLVAVDKSRMGKALDVLWFLVTEKRFQLDFSWGDKESFWLAYELAHQAYFFSPWGASVVSSSTNNDMTAHPDTLCGSLAQFLPVEQEGSDIDSGSEKYEEKAPELLYVNGKSLLEPFPLGVSALKTSKGPTLYNPVVTHVTPRHKREVAKPLGKFDQECLVGLGSTPLSSNFQRRLLRRRMLYLAIQSDVYSAATQCPDY